jgi:UPF0716 protein FxsA
LTSLSRVPLILILLFVVVPIAELYVIIQVGEAIGALPTIAILIADSILGSWLLRSQGRSAWRRFNEALLAGRAPTRETADGALIILGGALLITPGFLSDILGLFLLAPPTRALVRGYLARRVFGRFRVAMPGGGRRPRAPQRVRDDDDVVDGTAVDVDNPELHR